jgi:hypothetical protein
VRLLTSIVVCLAVGVAINWLQTQFIYPTPYDAFEAISKSVLVVFGLAQLSFKALWEKTRMHAELKPEVDRLYPEEWDERDPN